MTKISPSPTYFDRDNAAELAATLQESEKDGRTYTAAPTSYPALGIVRVEKDGQQIGFIAIETVLSPA